jgi:hypothetical protein
MRRVCHLLSLSLSLFTPSSLKYCSVMNSKNLEWHGMANFSLVNLNNVTATLNLLIL